MSNVPFLPSLTVESVAAGSDLQRDLAAGRAALQAELAKASPARPGDGWATAKKPETIHAAAAKPVSLTSTADAAKGRADLQREREAGIEFTVDRDGMQNDRSGVARRVAKVRCHDCGVECLVHQAKDAGSGEFTPDVPGRLAAFGWRAFDATWTCSGVCFERAKNKMAQHDGKPLPAVTRMNDQSYARGMYATPAVVAPVAPVAKVEPPSVAASIQQETTPAAIPVVTPQRPPQPQHSNQKHQQHRR